MGCARAGRQEGPLPETGWKGAAGHCYHGTAHADRDLAALGIRCPHLADYMPRLVEFMRAHPEIDSGAMA